MRAAAIWFSRCLLALFCAYWLALFIGTHWPNLRPPRVPAVNDKIMHFSAYCGLAMLGLAALPRIARRGPAWVLGFCGALLVYAVIDELLQIPVPGRTAEWADWVADALGVATGVSFFLLARLALSRLLQRNARASIEPESSGC